MSSVDTYSYLAHKEINLFLIQVFVLFQVSLNLEIYRGHGAMDRDEKFHYWLKKLNYEVSLCLFERKISKVFQEFHIIGTQIRHSRSLSRWFYSLKYIIFVHARKYVFPNKLRRNDQSVSLSHYTRYQRWLIPLSGDLHKIPNPR